MPGFRRRSVSPEHAPDREGLPLARETFLLLRGPDRACEGTAGSGGPYSWHLAARVSRERIAPGRSSVRLTSRHRTSERTGLTRRRSRKSPDPKGGTPPCPAGGPLSDTSRGSRITKPGSRQSRSSQPHGSAGLASASRPNQNSSWWPSCLRKSSNMPAPGSWSASAVACSWAPASRRLSSSLSTAWRPGRGTWEAARSASAVTCSWAPASRRLSSSQATAAGSSRATWAAGSRCSSAVACSSAFTFRSTASSVATAPGWSRETWAAGSRRSSAVACSSAPTSRSAVSSMATSCGLSRGK